MKANAKAKNPLDSLRLAFECDVRWEDLEGESDVVRRCGQCNLQVYNLAAMSKEEAISLVNETEGRLCAALWRRSDGTVLTRDCRGGRAHVKMGKIALPRDD